MSYQDTFKGWETLVNKNSFMDMLRNVFYIGKIRVPAYNEEPEQIVEGLHSAIIDVTTFNIVQDRLTPSKNKVRVYKADAPELYLRRFLRCPKCTRHLTGYRAKGNGGYYYYYCCSGEKKHLNVRADKVNGMFEEFISDLIPNREVLKACRIALTSIQIETEDKIINQIRALAQKVEEINRNQQVVDDKYISCKLSDENYQRISNRYQDEKQSIANEIELLQSTRKENVSDMIDYAISLISNLRMHFHDAPLEVKIKLLGSIFDSGLIYDDKINLTTKLNPMIEAFILETNRLRKRKKEKDLEACASRSCVPRADTQP